MTQKIFWRRDRDIAMGKLRDLQANIRELEDNHRYAEAEDLSAVEFLMIGNIQAKWPGAFDDA